MCESLSWISRVYEKYHHLLKSSCSNSLTDVLRFVSVVLCLQEDLYSFFAQVMCCALQVGCQKETDSMQLWLIKAARSPVFSRLTNLESN